MGVGEVGSHLCPARSGRKQDAAHRDVWPDFGTPQPGQAQFSGHKMSLVGMCHFCGCLTASRTTVLTRDRCGGRWGDKRFGL